MAVTNFSPLLGLALPTTGDLSGTWGVTVNDSITSLLDSAVAGTTTITADTDVTLSTTNGVANQARSSVLLCTGTRTGVKTITAPAKSKAYIVINATVGGYAVNLVGVGPTAGISIVAGEKCLVAWNGSDFVKVSTSVSTGDVFGPASSTDNAFTRFDSTTGKLLQNSTATLSDAGAPTFTGSVTVSGTSASGASLVLGEDTDNGTNKITLLAPSALAADLSLTLPTADGTNGQYIITNGSGQLSFQSPTGNVITNTQTFTSSGTWTKPSGANWVQVVMWGGGSSGVFGTNQAAGGGGGAYVAIIFAASSLSGTVSVTVGAGGAATTTATAQNSGGTTSFGSYASVNGGSSIYGGAGTNYNGDYGSSLIAFGNGYADAGACNPVYRSGTYSADFPGGNSILGGAGGGAAGNYGGGSQTNGGTSIYGGAGGNGRYGSAGTAGAQPGGGGGGSLVTSSGAGGAGQCVVYTW